MPLTARTFCHQFKSEDGTDESVTFRYPTTRERLDALEKMSQIYGSLEAADAEKEELAERVGWEKVREMMEYYLDLAEKLLVDASVQYEANGKPSANVTEQKEWKELLLSDLYYGEQIQDGMMQFFRDVLSTKLAGTA